MNSGKQQPSEYLLEAVAKQTKRLCDSILLFAGLEIDTRYNGSVMTSIGHEDDLKSLEQACKHLDTSIRVNYGAPIYPEYVLGLANDVMGRLSTLRDNDHFRTQPHSGVSISLSTQSGSPVTKVSQKSLRLPRSRVHRRRNSRVSTSKLDISSKYSESFPKKDTRKLLSLRIAKDSARSRTSDNAQKQQSLHTRTYQYSSNDISGISESFTKSILSEMEKKIQNSTITPNQSLFSVGSPDDIACVPQGLLHLSGISNEPLTNCDGISVDYDGEEL